MPLTVVVDCFPERAPAYVDGYAIVAVDVIRATTTAVTAVAQGRRCFPVPSVEAARALLPRLGDALLVGEQDGRMPPGFALNNSPADLAARGDIARPVILLSSSGTRLIHAARGCEATYVACLRNAAAVARQLARQHARVAVLGAGARGEFRKEDQICCAWIAADLLDVGYKPGSRRTATIIERWRGASAGACADGKSAEYLRTSGQQRDLAFVLAHVNDLDTVCAVKEDEIVQVPADREQSGRGIEGKASALA
jgi:2-phosphosulfolactate phosphatase